MIPYDINVLAFDLDGTLTQHKSIENSNSFIGKNILNIYENNILHVNN